MIPRAFQAAAEFVLNTRLRRALGSEQSDFESIRKLVGDAESAKIALDVPTLEFTLRTRVEHMAHILAADPDNLNYLTQLDKTVSVARSLPLEVNLWKTQNVCYELLQTRYAELLEKSEEGGQNAGAWIERFRELAEKLSLRVEPLTE